MTSPCLRGEFLTVSDTAPPIDLDSRRAIVQRLAEVVRGLSFRDDDQPRDRISGASLVVVIQGLIEPTACPAGQITEKRGLRVVQRVLAFLRAEGLVCEQHFREGGSPRVMRSIDWQRLEAWIEQPEKGYQKQRVPKVIEVEWKEEEPEGPSRAEPGQTGPIQEETDFIPPDLPCCAPPEPLRAISGELVSLGVMPDCLDSTTLPLPKIRRLIDHYIGSGLENPHGETEYAWGPGLLYARICSPKLAMLGPDNWPPSVNKEWLRLKAIADRERRLAREAAEANLLRKADDDRSTLHQLELRFPGLNDVETIMQRLAALPDPPRYLMSGIKQLGLKSFLKVQALTAIATAEGA